MAGYNDYRHNKNDSAATRIKKAQAAKRGIQAGHQKARDERARIAERIEMIGQRNDAGKDGGTCRRDVIWYITKLATGLNLKCHKVG